VECRTTSRVGSAQNITGIGWELDAIAATVIGGPLLLIFVLLQRVVARKREEGERWMFRLRTIGAVARHR